MITLDTSALGQMDTKTLQEKMEEKKKLMVIVIVTSTVLSLIDFNPLIMINGFLVDLTKSHVTKDLYDPRVHAVLLRYFYYWHVI